MRKFLFLAVAAVAAVCCSTRPKTSSRLPERDFPSAQVPGVMTDQNDALEWVADHFWDKFLDHDGRYLCDSTHVRGVPSDILENQVGLYTTLLQQVPRKVALRSTGALFDKIAACQMADTASNLVSGLVPMISRYLYDPNSPVRDEDLYRPFAQALSESPLSGDLATSYAFEARMCSLNQIGTKAADFRFRDLWGRTRNLYSVKAPLTLLFFSNPGCPNCQEIIDYIKSNLSDRVSDGSLAVVSVYIDDDLPAWREYAPNYPREWYCGYDPDGVIRDSLLYCVRAIPSLYLLDEDKTVLLKDAPEHRVYDYLSRL